MFPKSTELNKRIPKTKFYENLQLNKRVKRSFLDDIDTIVCSNKIAPSTVNVREGDKVSEIEVFTITLKSGKFDVELLRVIDEQIPYHLLFIIVSDDRYSAWISYKVKSRGKPFRVVSYYNTGKSADKLPDLELDGIDMDGIYQGFIKQIATSDGETEWNDNITLDENVKQIEYVKKIKAEIEKLEIRKLKESQPNKKLELHNRIIQLRGKI